ncbi:LuxR C-terminal-related transcriptional regulator [Kitasatospora sp. NPDC088779]|uniref:LuxR C-terminal-related transcriptional regulator n=1 Tax=Kitasatospora sp. NPDC088779 TaxID=3154964 RepID=UPI00343BBECB
MTTTHTPDAPVHGLPCPGCGTTVTVTTIQRDVLHELAWGASTHQITEYLDARGIHSALPPTIKSRGAAEVDAIQRTLNASGCNDAVDIACRLRILVPPKGLRLPPKGIPEGLLRTAALIARGMDHAAVAHQLGLKEKSVSGHMARLRALLGAANTPHAIYSLHALDQLPAHHPCPCRYPFSAHRSQDKR